MYYTLQVQFQSVELHRLSPHHFDSSMGNSRESTSIIIIIPPGKILLVVISRSLCECHMKAKPASEPGGLAIVPEGGVEPVAPQFGELVCGVPALPRQPVARRVAFGPR